MGGGGGGSDVGDSSVWGRGARARKGNGKGVERWVGGVGAVVWVLLVAGVRSSKWT